MNGPRVLHVLDHSLPQMSGYSVRSHYTLRAQAKHGMRPTAISSPKQGASVDDECIDGQTYVRAPAVPLRLSLAGVNEVRLMVRLGARLGDVVRQRGIELIHAHSPVLNGVAALWAGRRAGLPVVYEMRALWEDAAVAHGRRRRTSAAYRFSRGLETWMLHRADAVGVISAGLMRDVLQRGVRREKLFSVPNGVDIGRFQAVEPDPGLRRQFRSAGEVVFGFVGSLLGYEGLDILLRAFAQVVSTLPHARVVLVGDGPELPRLQAEAARLRLTSRVHFAGGIDHADIRRWYSICDVLVYPRRSTRLTELTTPLKPLEAMAMSKPVIASDVAGLRELIRDGRTGALFAAADVTALAATLARLATDAGLRKRLGEQARHFVCEERDWNALAHVYVEIYRHLLAGRGMRRNGG